MATNSMIIKFSDKPLPPPITNAALAILSHQLTDLADTFHEHEWRIDKTGMWPDVAGVLRDSSIASSKTRNVFDNHIRSAPPSIDEIVELIKAFISGLEGIIIAEYQFRISYQAALQTYKISDESRHLHRALLLPPFHSGVRARRRTPRQYRLSHDLPFRPRTTAQISSSSTSPLCNSYKTKSTPQSDPPIKRPSLKKAPSSSPALASPFLVLWAVALR